MVTSPQISDKYSTFDLSVVEGASAKFICSATGYPQPTIIWQRMPKSPKEKDKIRLPDRKDQEIHKTLLNGSLGFSVLELKKVSKEDMGTYLCIAKNNVPPTVSKKFKLTVNCEFCKKK